MAGRDGASRRWLQQQHGFGVQLTSAVRTAIERHACVTTLFLNGREPETGLYRMALQIDYLLAR